MAMGLWGGGRSEWFEGENEQKCIGKLKVKSVEIGTNCRWGRILGFRQFPFRGRPRDKPDTGLTPAKKKTRLNAEVGEM